MSRLSDALEKLRTKCTIEGVTPADDTVDALIDCIAEHFDVAGDKEPQAFYVTATITDPSTYAVTLDKSFAEIKAAHDSGKQIYLTVPDMNGRTFQANSFANTFIAFSDVAWINSAPVYFLIQVFSDNVTVDVTKLAEAEE